MRMRDSSKWKFDRNFRESQREISRERAQKKLIQVSSKSIHLEEEEEEPCPVLGAFHIDNFIGMTVLHDRKFNVSNIMPICLPSSREFKDDDRGTLITDLIFKGWCPWTGKGHWFMGKVAVNGYVSG